MEHIEESRLEDFKRILTFKTVSKIKYNFKGNYEGFYSAPKIWMQWRNHELAYDRTIYAMIIAFNQIAFSARQVQHIFGKTEDRKWIPYGKIIESDPSIKVYNKGTICMRDAEKKELKRIQVWKRYQLPKEHIAAIFADADLLEKVLDPESDYYTPRQRVLLYTQVLKKGKSYHFKVKEERERELRERAKRIKAEMEDQAKVDALFANGDMI